MRGTVRLAIRAAVVLLAIVGIGVGVTVTSRPATTTLTPQAYPTCGTVTTYKGYQVTATYIHVWYYKICSPGGEEQDYPVNLKRLIPVSPPIYWQTVATGTGHLFYYCPGSLPGVFLASTDPNQFTANCAT
jgi:hypothetical protein